MRLGLRVVIAGQVTGPVHHWCWSRSHRRSPGMIAVKLKGTVTKDHRLELTIPPSIPPGEVEVIVLHPEPPPRSRVRGHKQPPTVHPAAGLWADREDIG